MFAYFSMTYRIITVGLLIGCGLFCVACQQPNDALKDLSTDQVSVVNALDKVIIPLQDADPNRDFAELAPLDSVFAKAQVIGLGEGTHGTREFFQMKHRLFAYLVQKHGFRTMAFEANFGRSVIVNRFIHGQSTNLPSAAEAAKSMFFWTWSTTEVRDLLQWMKDYNMGKSAAQQLSFYGFDCQYGEDEFPLLKEFLTKVDPKFVVQVDTLSSLYVTQGTLPTSYAQRLPALTNLFVANESKWVATVGRTDYEMAKQAVRVLVQQQDLRAAETNCSYSLKRDKYMAENIQWMVGQTNVGKVSLWAHNGHICNLAQYYCYPTMGYYLKQQLKDKYLPIGTLFTNGTFTVVRTNSGLGPRSVQTAAGSYNYLLGKAKSANFALTMNQAVSNAILLNWLNGPEPLFEIGAVYDETKDDRTYTGLATLTGRFDLLIHFRNTNPTQLLP